VLHAFTGEDGVFEIPLLAGALDETVPLAGVQVISHVAASAPGWSSGGPDASKQGELVITLHRPVRFTGKLIGALPRNAPQQVVLLAGDRTLAKLTPGADGSFDAWIAEPPTKVNVRMQDRTTKSFEVRAYADGSVFEIDLGK
jgi:hypothetical protein